MSPKLITFHKVVSECEEGSREAWQAFLGDYTPIAFQLVDIYLLFPPPLREEFWREALGALAVNNFEPLRKFEHQAEREFLVGLRAFLLDRGATKLDPAQDSRTAPRPTVETVHSLLKGLPLIHQEILFLKLAGYSDGSLEKLLRITPGVAQKGLERLQADYATILARPEDKCPWPAAWGEVMRLARAAKKENCPALRQFVRIQEGHTNWYDKDPVEEHLSGCLHCLERWTALREIWHWRREAKPRPAVELDGLLTSLPVRAETKARQPFLRRMLE